MVNYKCKKLSRNYQESMNTKGVNEVAEFLLYGYLCDSMPEWKKLPRAVKHKLMKKLGEKSYTNIHDPMLYEDLDRIWNARKNMKEDDIRDRANLSNKVECSVCLETYDGNDKVTTLMCGHKFCSNCIFQHIHRHRDDAKCPLCRRYVFQMDTHVVPSWSGTGVFHEGEEDVELANLELDRKRVKRQYERKRRRERKRELA